MIANKKTRKLLTFILCLSTSGIISRLWWGVSRLVVDWLLVGAHVVDVVVVLPVSSVFVRPLQLIYTKWGQIFVFTLLSSLPWP